MKQKQNPVRREFWEKLLDIDMFASLRATSRVEMQRKHMANKSSFISGQLAIPILNSAETTIGITVIGEAVKETPSTSQATPAERVMNSLYQSSNSETQNNQHLNRIQPDAEALNLPKLNATSNKCVLIPDIDIGEILTLSATSANDSNDEQTAAIKNN